VSYTRVIPGARYGRLLVEVACDRTNAGKKLWRCVCDCGNVTHVPSGHLNSGHTQSCGCLSRETARSNRLAEQKHGAAKNASPTPTYVSWLSMRKRCLSPVNKDYPGWGGRGICIAPEWDDFSSFLADMGERPPGTSLDRIDNNGDYCKENCRWATAKQQGRNQRSTKLNPELVKAIIADTRPQAVIASDYGVNQVTISVVKRGRTWSDD